MEMKTMDENNEIFTYKYSAEQQNEIKRIKEKYTTEEQCESGLERLRRLDRSATEKGTVASMISGVLSVLIMGGGMSLCLEGPERLFAAGIIIGAVGIIGVAMAYPIYTKITKKEREKIAPEIIKISDELLK